VSTLRDMQATVASYDEATRAGTVVTDGGETLGFAGETLADHIRHLRQGQRVHLGVTGDGIARVALW
jgi:2-phospho-L-lactate/phosphoenolpyruvate guanylyltransferase